MFLEKMQKRNPELIEKALYLHQNNILEPDTYILDLDQIQANSALMAETAAENNLKLYFMSKQLGRNPLAAQAVVEAGIKKAVAVDPWEARTLAQAGIQLGNVGHLVQVPTSMLEEMIAYEPEIMTVYSLQKAEQISKIALRQNRVQPIMIRIYSENSFNYKGQVGGFDLKNLEKYIPRLIELEGVEIKGVTAFPCLLFNYKKQKIETTPNLELVIKTAKILNDKYGLTIEQLNTPSVSCQRTIPILADAGATHGEPGHALTGTTPYHAYHDDGEKPAMIYISEVSHIKKSQAYTFGGGFYSRSHLKNALVASTSDQNSRRIYPASQPEADMIDYYASLENIDQKLKVGDTVLYAFRTQIFVTRSRVAVISGIQHGKLKLQGIYSSQGRLIDKKGGLRF
ncbi:YhfX family PLP-dependent enzyme [Halanaerobium sp. ST460_2HS_T2]|jgi:predicted amino acid racemase|uniref:YhfX family PLP-dependent enzyme n=1 Tax=Halanaerobium sp. ST460_2HS_T2 TaxID=2183914 RepID=UPI000DF475BB|nr:YhfX family PLP-dependent enzyme [Halanaerobium sp. ST460_2HS_T2]RCW61042.1 putative amino acid racemase [Halanaerobium sp. ST460_2HS_T2]